jgi:hypothetical protein
LGYKTAKKKVLAALVTNSFDHEPRNGIDVKNLLAMGQISSAAVADLIAKSSGRDHSESPHHQVKSVVVHCVKVQGWYIKFYFLDPRTTFISVHQ